MEPIDTPISAVPDGCFLQVDSPPLITTQGADLEIRFCAEKAIEVRPTIACVGTDYLTVDVKTIAAVGDIIELQCLDGADFLSLAPTRQTIAAISADGLRIEVTPGFTGVTTEKCYRPVELDPLDGCISLTATDDAPRFVILSDKWTLRGIAAHRISNGCVRTVGVTSTAGSRYVKTALVGVVQPGDHMAIPGTGIDDAIVKSVRASESNGVPSETIELDAVVTVGGCFAAMVADGLLLSFDIESDGPCSIASLPASKTALLSPPHGVEVPAESNPESFLGHYLFVAQSVTISPAGIPKVKTRAIASGLLILKSTVASSNRLGDL